MEMELLVRKTISISAPDATEENCKYAQQDELIAAWCLGFIHPRRLELQGSHAESFTCQFVAVGCFHKFFINSKNQLQTLQRDKIFLDPNRSLR
jgi:hypothetical protein